MNVTLAKMLQTSAYKNKSVLELKKTLLSHRSMGMIFFLDNLSNLDLTDSFDMYFCYTPSQYSNVNAFPIPADQFRFPRNEEGQYALLSAFYFEYYHIKLSRTEFTQYKKNKPYKGKDYIWYHRDNVESFA
jgi:hypothetical protein